MKNKHLDHPEDAILLEGREGLNKVLNFFREKNSQLSVKYDGSPAVVWGINPENKKFFVGTKSVFNKIKIKINYTHYDIEINHGHTPAVASILHMCLEKLPRVEGIYQGDFIGYGGGSEYTPNTITYNFNDIVDEDIIIAAHTTYSGDTIKDSVASFGCDKLASEECKFLNTNANFLGRDYKVGWNITLCGIFSLYVNYPTDVVGRQLKTYINSYIRMGLPIDAKKIAKETKCNVNLIRLYNMVTNIKEMLMGGIESYENVYLSIGSDPCEHEGYVMSNKHGTYKLIKRHGFSHANFTKNDK
jgi:hypothetical protein